MALKLRIGLKALPFGDTITNFYAFSSAATSLIDSIRESALKPIEVFMRGSNRAYGVRLVKVLLGRYQITSVSVLYGVGLGIPTVECRFNLICNLLVRRGIVC
jgi:hypothetical protein